MNALSNLKYDDSVKEERDVLGGSRILDSNVYDGTIKMAYLTTSSGGSLGLNLVVALENGTEYKETLYVTNKEGKNFYVKDGVKNYLQGFIVADGIALFGAQKSISELSTEKKVVKIYNYDTKSEVPTEVDCVVDLLNAPVKLGIVKELALKQEKNAAGVYVDKVPAETRESNNINKVFHPKNGKTIAECRAKAETAEFITEWTNKWQGQVNDKTKGKTPESKAGAPAPVSKSASTLFN